MTASPVCSMRAMSKPGTDSSVCGELGESAAPTAFASACTVASAAGLSSRAPDAGGETAGAAAVAALVSTGGPRRMCVMPTKSTAPHAATSPRDGTTIRVIDVAVMICDPLFESLAPQLLKLILRRLVAIIKSS
jgi:hypothetical protein